jgi:hypothetical protein
MTTAEYLHCAICGCETLHTVVRNGQGTFVSSACKDPKHATRAAEEAILGVLKNGSIDAADIPTHRELGLHAQQAVTRAVVSLEAAGRLIVLRETSDRENPFPFSGLLPVES